MNDEFLNTIKNERRGNLGKRFNIWIDAQWGYEWGSFNKWRVDEERALREITESILLDPNNKYFTYKHNKLLSSPDDILFGNIIHIDILVFKELLRDYRLKEILDFH
jgi:hypothetical protein